jgi:transcription-repair coupling factor
MRYTVCSYLTSSAFGPFFSVSFHNVPASDALRKLADQLSETGSGRLIGVPHSTAEAFALSELFELVPKAWQIIYLVGSEREQQTALDGLKQWSTGSRNVVALPPITADLLPRLQHHEPVILVAQQSAFAESLPHPNEIQKQFVTLSLNDTSSPVQIAEALTRLGYSPSTPPSAPGEWSRRGEVVHIWPIGYTGAVRVTFDSTTIESIHDVDGKKIETISCAPAVMQELDPRISLLAYLQPMRTLIVVPRPTLLDTLPRGRDAIKQYKQLHLEPFGEGVKLDWRSAAFYHSQWKLAAKDLKRLQDDGFSILVRTNRRDELEAQLKRNAGSVKKFTWIDQPHLTQGFIAPSAKTAFFTDEELFGHNDRAKANRRRVEDVFLGELREGDHVVHLDHGIGKFTGMRLQQVNGHTREYFVLEYAGADKLYVPVETADKITRYIGSPNPKMHRLSGSTWAAVTKKIREDASKTARELLDLYANRELAQAPQLLAVPDQEELLDAVFPYQLTPDQERTLQETMNDLERDVPMDRLVCGDVGFGKTEVAIRAAFRAVANGYQVALLSPTTILTQQHYDTFKNRLKDFHVRLGVISRFEKHEEQNEALAQLASGDIDIIVGTHRLLSKDVQFKKLGLIIIDEEQRFGVRHKEELKRLRTEAHVLTLTATPIPRTLNFALSGLRDISVIETAPEGRRPGETNIMVYSDDLVKEVVQRELNRKGQVYFVHNQVETMDLAKAHLEEILPGVTIGIAHGQMDERSLVSVMEKFDNQQLDILLASTIIENGLDLPNVNTLIVDYATKFGLAQLYQLRGRVGRGDRQAYAYFLYRSEKVTGKPEKRLQALMEATELGSGFQLAMRDLEIRGTGNILGKKQHGHVTAIGLNLYARLLAQAVEELRTGKPARQNRDILIDLPMEIGIPQDFLQSEPKRLRLYQRIAAIESVEELDEFRTEEFGDQRLPEPLVNLFEAVALKILAQQSPITAIQQSNYSVDGISKEKILIKFAHMITPEQIGKLLERNQAWDFTPEFIKIDREALGKNWLHELRAVVTIFEDTNPVREKK